MYARDMTRILEEKKISAKILQVLQFLQESTRILQDVSFLSSKSATSRQCKDFGSQSNIQFRNDNSTLNCTATGSLIERPPSNFHTIFMLIFKDDNT